MPELNEDRVLEIRLYIFLRRLDKEFKHHISRLDMIQLLGDTFDFSGSTIINLDRRRLQDAGWGNEVRSWTPDKIELVYTLKKIGYSVRKIYRDTGITQRTQYKILESIEANPNIIPKLAPRTDDFELGEIKRFMTVAERMKIVWR